MENAIQKSTKQRPYILNDSVNVGMWQNEYYDEDDNFLKGKISYHHNHSDLMTV